MDLNIIIKDEDGVVLQQVNIYQDGSDSEGAQKVVDFIKDTFKVDESDWANPY